MELHHLGYACQDIRQCLTYLKSAYRVKSISAVVYDPLQQCEVCLVEVIGSPTIELVSGNPVERFIDQTFNLYHTCYEVEDLQIAIEQHLQQGSSIISAPKPAILFNNRYVVFLQTPLGLVELLEKNATYQTNSRNSYHTIVISGNFTTDYLFENIKRLCLKLELNMMVEQAPYNQLIQCLIDENSVMNSIIDGINLIFINPEEWLTSVSELEAEKIDLFNENGSMLVQALDQRANTHGQYHIFFGPLPRWAECDDKISTACMQILDKMKSDLADCQNISFTLPKALPFIDEGIDYHNALTNKIAHVPFSDEMQLILSVAGIRTAFNAKQKRYKVVVVDCDNTLWQGLCGSAESAAVEVTLGHQLFQRKLIELSEKGLLICLCSKNNEADVFHVFDTLSTMILHRDHITDYKINWENKSQNILELAQTLNLSLEDFIFVDDSPVECEAIRSALPQILVIKFPENGQNIQDWIDSIWAFHVTKQSNFDKQRGRFHKDNSRREKIKRRSTNLEDFITSIEVKTCFKSMQLEDYDRVVQLYSRVNQFTMNHSRYTYKDIVQRLDQSYHFITVTVTDKFGDYGTVGVLCYQVYEKSQMYVHSFLLSCRALGRGVEYEMLSWLARKAYELQ